MYDDDEKIYAQRPVKAALKREAEADKALILRMIKLGNTHFKALDISDKLRDAISDARRFKTAALKRQILYTVGIMRDEDSDAIRAQIDALERPALQEVEAFHQLEQWRDALLAGDNTTLDTLITTFETLDIQHIRQLVRNAQKEQKQNKPPKSARALFQYLKTLQEDS